LSIRSWKSRLPNGAPWLGGFSKGRIAQRDERYLERFIAETRRAEFAHWCMLLCLPVFFLWNPPWACGVMTLYAITANVPCIAAQRYNRITLTRLLTRAGQIKI
jgi:glycosyl-4,4'-diaponeurosporenoate acyltransferase